MAKWRMAKWKNGDYERFSESVACLSTLLSRTLLSWNIFSAREPEYSFRDFFYDSIQPRIPSTSSLSYELVHAGVGASKEKWSRLTSACP